MRYKIVIYPMLSQSLVVISTAFDDQMRNETRYGRTYSLKTKGSEWPLPDMLREIADQWENTD